MKEKIRDWVYKIFNILFWVSLATSVGIDAYYKFDVAEESKGYNIALLGYLYSCLYLAIKLSKNIIKIKNQIVRLFIFVLCWTIPLVVVVYIDELPNNGILSTIVFLVFSILFLSAISLTLYHLYKIRKLIFRGILGLVVLSLLVWVVVDKGFYKNDLDKQKNEEVKESTFLIQPWQLNSRYKFNKVVKFIKVDLDNDGKEEIAAITSYDKIPDDVFYCAGFYRYNPVSEMWDEFYGEELNILNYATAKNEIEPSKLAEFIKTFVDMWSTEFTSIKNIGDITGDGYPEVVFSSLLQGKNFDNYIIVVQNGESHYVYKIFGDQNTMAEIVVEDGLLIEKYYDENYDFKKIFEWDKKGLYFKLIETQKTKKIILETPKIDPEIEKITG